MENYSIQKQTERRNQLFSLYRDFMGECIGDNGKWYGKEEEMGTREKIWHCLALLEGDDRYIQRANKILGDIILEKCQFAPMNCMQILLKHEKKLSSGIINKLENYIRISLKHLTGPNIHFTMFNDNFASMATFTLLAAGERFDDRMAFDAGMEKLNQLKERYMRCGVLMEYCSSTYLPITITAMAEIANYVKDEEARNTALKCEERAWAEAACYYHAPSGHLAGPYSRAYTVDTLGHPGVIQCLLYMMFGDEIIINPIKDMFPHRPGLVVHHGLERLMWPSVIWTCSGFCHCPAYLREILLHKPFPYTILARAEGLPCLTEGYRSEIGSNKKIRVNNQLEYQAYSGPLSTYMTENYAMGTAFSQYHDGGLSDSFHIVYRKNNPALDITQTSAVFCRYIINDKKPETINHYSVYGDSDGFIGFRDEARKFGIQHKNCSMMVYKPKQYEAHHIFSMKLSILFPCHFRGVDEIWLGDRRLDNFTGESQKPETVYVKDGPVYMAFTPLELFDHGRKAAVKVEKDGNYILLSFYNYEGEPRAFSAKKLFLTSSGFIAHVYDAFEIESFQAFRQVVGEYSLTDVTTSQQGGYTRWIRYKHRDTDLHFAYSPVGEGIMIASINGRPRPEPVFSATGIEPDQLPYL